MENSLSDIIAALNVLNGRLDQFDQNIHDLNNRLSLQERAQTPIPAAVAAVATTQEETPDSAVMGLSKFLAKPERFTGSRNPKVVSSFLNQMRTYLSTLPYNDLQKLSIVGSYLSHTALTWFSRQEFTVLEKFYKEFAAYFLPQNSAIQNYSALSNLTQRGTVSKYH